jgi:hypothetical protein
MSRHDAVGFAQAKKKPEQTKATEIAGEHFVLHANLDNSGLQPECPTLM